ncbi:MAG: hypothetical protein HC930_05915, partial [Hydrococcus sp. SU_1_0]|nr:hypothetical protein [Hydrococcus sp. SU_1_0]
MAMESLFAVIDVYFVSQLHDNDAVATIGLTESILTLIYSLAMGLSMGATAMVARRVGEKDIKAAEVAAAQAIFLGIGLSLAITWLGFSFAAAQLPLRFGPSLSNRYIFWIFWIFIVPHGELPALSRKISTFPSEVTVSRLEKGTLA